MNLSPGVEAGLFVAVLALLIATRVVSVARFAFLSGFVVPLLTPRLTFGVGIDWYKVIGPICLVLMVGTKSPARKAAREMRWVVLYVVAVSLIWMILEYTVLKRYRAAEAFGLETGSTYYKMPVQLGSFVGQLLTVYAIPQLAREEAHVSAALRGFTAGCMASVAIGLGFWAVTGDGMVVSRGVSFEADGFRLSRLGGLSGEPKHLGAFLVILSLYQVCVFTLSRGRHGRPAPLVLAFALTGLALTFATSAWSGMVIGLVVAFGISLLLGRWRRVGLLGLGLALGAILVLANPMGRTMYETRFEGRLFGRQSEVGRQKDTYVLRALQDNPRDVIWGYGLGGGDLEVIRYIPPGERWYRRPPTPGVTGVRILGDLGIAGLLALTALVAVWAKRFLRAGDKVSAAFALVGFVACMFMSLNALSAFLFVVGALLARASIRGLPESSGLRAGELRTA